MANTIETLSVQINANAKSAYTAIGKLSSNLEHLSSVLSGLDMGKMSELSGNVAGLGTSMQALWASTKTSDFSRLSKNLNGIAAVDSSGVNATADAIKKVTSSFTGLSQVAKSSTDIASLAQSIGKLGSKSIQNATANLPALATALKEFMVTISGAPTVDKNIINMTNALANLAAQGRSMGSASRSLVNGLNKTDSTLKKSSKSVTSLAAAFGKLYASYFLVIRGVKAFYNAIESTADYIEAFNYFTVTFEKIANEWSKDYEKYAYDNAEVYAESFSKRLNSTINKMSGLNLDETNQLIVESGMKNLGMNLTQLTQYASGIASITNAIGTTGEVSVATSKAVTMLAADLGSLKNLDFDTVSANIQSALTGQARALYKYGIDVTNATLETYAATAGITKNVSEMTQAEKMQLRLLAILDQSKVAWGDLANTINSPSNMIRQLKNNLSECGTVLGQLFIPMLTKVLPIINGVTIAIKRLLVNVAGLLGIQIDLSSFGQGYTDNLDELEGALEDTAEAADKAKKGIRGFDELNVISSTSNKSTASDLTDTIDLTDEIIAATAEYERIWNEAYDQMINKAEAFAGQVEQALEPLKKIFEDFVIGDYFTMGSDVSELVYQIELFFSKAIKKVNWDKIGSDIGDFLRGLDWKKMLSGLADIIFAAIEASLKLWKGSFDAAPVETAVISAIALLKFSGVGSVLGTALHNAILASPAGDFVAKVESALKIKTSGIVLGAVGLSVGVLLTISGIKALSKSSSKEDTIKNAIITAIGTDLAAVGGAGLITGIAGLVGGSVSFGAALAITLPVTLMLTIIGIARSEQEQADANLLQNTAFASILSDLSIIQEKAELVKSTWEETKTAINENLSDIDYDGQTLSKMAEDYYKLSQTYNTLTDTEKGLLAYYKEVLSKEVPGITEHIDEITGAYTGTYEELNKVIAAELARLKQQAYSDAILEGYKSQIALEKQLTDATDAQSRAQTELSNSTAKYEQAAEVAYKSLGTFKGQMFSAYPQAKTLNDYISVMNEHFEDGARPIYSYEKALYNAWLEMKQGQETVEIATQNVEGLQGALDDASANISEWSIAIGKAYADASSNVTNAGLADAIVNSTAVTGTNKSKLKANANATGGTYTKNLKNSLKNNGNIISETIAGLTKLNGTKLGEIKSSAESIGENVNNGIVQGIENTSSVVEDAMKRICGKMTNVVTTEFMINSPSKLFAMYGKYIDMGLANGITDNSKVAESASYALANAVNDKFAMNNIALNKPSVTSASASAQNYSSSANNANSSTGLLNSLAKNIAGALNDNGQTQVTFKVEGDPNGIFKVVQKEARSFNNRTGQMAFAN